MAAKKQTAFQPRFSITPAMAGGLMRIEADRQAILALPLTPRALARLRETARLSSTHYSTLIDGNRLTPAQVTEVTGKARHYAGRERDESEVKGYYAALDEVERLAARGDTVSETAIQRLHALAMGGGKTRVKATPYRDGQNVIRDARSGAILYMPPEANDVPMLMEQLIAWVNQDGDLPVPMRAGIAHYQYATIHPYYGGNGRTARLLTTLLLHLGGYGLKGLSALEEYYARDLKAYYDALTVGPSHNYYLGRAEADITGWIGYFLDGMAFAFEKARTQASREAGKGRENRSRLLRTLDGTQRKAVSLFQKSSEITARDIAGLFGYQPRTAALLCQRWVASGFLAITDSARKSRKYRLGSAYAALADGSE
jgi:Fic family protein